MEDETAAGDDGPNSLRAHLSIAEEGYVRDIDQPGKSLGLARCANDEALANLEKDHEFLLRGGVFTEDLLQTWIELKREENDYVRLRPHPAEFFQYFDA